MATLQSRISKPTLLPSAPGGRVLRDISNTQRLMDAKSASGAVVKNAQPAAATQLPSIRTSVPSSDFQSGAVAPAPSAPVVAAVPSVAPIDPMDTSLEENIAEMSITPGGSGVSGGSLSPLAGLASVDHADLANAQAVGEYAQEILSYWRASELKRAPNPNYMSRQSDINPKMREILADWLVEVQLKFKLKQETLFLAIHILDRFLERRAVTRSKLQLVGCTAMLLAAKYEEIWAPEVQDFVCISDKAYTREQILAMEGIMLNALGFNLTVPLSLNFLQRFARLAGVSMASETWFLAQYFLELTLQTYSFLAYPPSHIAASALFLAQSTAANSSLVWSAQAQKDMDLTPAQIAGCIQELFKLVDLHQSGQSKYKAVKKKYSAPKLMEVAKYQCRNPM